jgi:hypothetical protein
MFFGEDDKFAYRIEKLTPQNSGEISALICGRRKKTGEIIEEIKIFGVVQPRSNAKTSEIT